MDRNNKHPLLLLLEDSMLGQKAAMTFSVVPITSCGCKFQEWSYFKHTSILTAYWEWSPSKYSLSAPMHLALWWCHCWKRF